MGLWRGTGFSSEGLHLLGTLPWEIFLIGTLGKKYLHYENLHAIFHFDRY